MKRFLIFFLAVFSLGIFAGQGVAQEEELVVTCEDLNTEEDCSINHQGDACWREMRVGDGSALSCCSYVCESGVVAAYRILRRLFVYPHDRFYFIDVENDGDVNGDGKVDPQDAIQALQNHFNMNPPQAMGMARLIRDSIIEFVRGDVNNDGVFDLSDVVYFSNWFNRNSLPAPTCMKAADINDDGLVDMTDVSLFPNAYYYGEVSLPFPQPGKDPTPDGLTCEMASCANGVVEGFEECDDGNKINRDGCSSLCQRESTLSPDVQFVRGDLDLNGTVNSNDAALLQRFLNNGLTFLPCKDAGDINNDEVINQLDLQQMNDYLSRKLKSLAGPFPYPGSDSSGITLNCSKGL